MSKQLSKDKLKKYLYLVHPISVPLSPPVHIAPAETRKFMQLQTSQERETCPCLYSLQKVTRSKAHIEVQLTY